VVEGTVGSGKTSLIGKFVEKYGYRPFYELSDPMIEKMLEHFYRDRKRWAFTLQILFLTSRFEQIRRSSEIGKAVLDRSIFGDLVFAKMLHRYGDMKDHEFGVYKRLYSDLISVVAPPYLMIYIRIPTELAIERIKKRGREYELVVEREYWENLNREYEKFFESYSLSPLFIIDASKYDWVNSEKDGEYVVSEIRKVMERSVKGEFPSGYRIEI
jgi:deoxyadenosine/deoxycytidine kinase